MEIGINHAKDPYKPTDTYYMYLLSTYIMEFHADFERCSDLFSGAGDSNN